MLACRSFLAGQAEWCAVSVGAFSPSFGEDSGRVSCVSEDTPRREKEAELVSEDMKEA